MIRKVFKKKKYIILCMIFLALFSIGITFSKYISDFVKYYIINADSFYFDSDKLEENGITYNINNWGGIDNFIIQFELNNHKNNLLSSKSDISYNLEINCGEGLSCSITSGTGIIYRAEMTDSYEIIVTPLRTFDTGESGTVSITATSTNPYIKELSANFVVTVGKQGIDYEIIDKAGQPYFNFIITNSLEQYKVISAFDDYVVGDYILADIYRTLSSDKKEKCASAIITLNFDPSIVLIDTTSNKIKNAIISNSTVNGVEYISSLTFNINASSSLSLRFYKKNVNNNYTYPIVNESSVVSFDAVV